MIFPQNAPVLTTRPNTRNAIRFLTMINALVCLWKKEFQFTLISISKIHTVYDITRKITRIAVRPTQNRGFRGGSLCSRILSIFVLWPLKKKSEVLEYDPDVDKKIHGHTLFYTYGIFYIEKKFSVFFWHKSRSLYITLWSTQ